MRLLLVEDEDPKREKIAVYIRLEWPQIELHEAKSVRAAIDKLRQTTPDVLLLDMSLPTFDITDNESGGRPQGFGGKEVLKYKDKLRKKCATIVITGYEIFVTESQTNLTLDDINTELTRKYKDDYLGIVYYNSLYEDWKKDLGHLISKALEIK